VIAAASAAAVSLTGSADLSSQEVPVTLDEALKRILGEAKPAGGRIVLDLPEIAENGNTVPFSVAVDSPMTEQDHVKAIHILATANPRPNVASFRFSKLSGKAQVASRMRLAQTQDVIAIAEFGDGKFFLVRRPVKVTIGGCGGS
jgi:sulfur-oxidizing protein SoxY